MQDLTIQDWDMLISARAERTSPEQAEYYLDRETGELSFFGMETVKSFGGEEEEPPSIEWQRTELDNYRQIFEEPGRYVVVEQAEAQDTWERMAAFARSVEDQSAAKKLHAALEGKGAFRRFTDEVVAADLQNEWSAFEYRSQIAEAIGWLESVGIRPTNPPQKGLEAKRSGAEQKLERELRGAVKELEDILRALHAREIDDVEASLLAKRLGQQLAQ